MDSFVELADALLSDDTDKDTIKEARRLRVEAALAEGKTYSPKIENAEWFMTVKDPTPSICLLAMQRLYRIRDYEECCTVAAALIESGKASSTELREAQDIVMRARSHMSKQATT